MGVGCTYVPVTASFQLDMFLQIGNQLTRREICYTHSIALSLVLYQFHYICSTQPCHMRYTALLLIHLLPAFLAAQNHAPRASGIRVSHDAASRQITVTYDLDDDEGDTATVVLQQSIGGASFLNATQVTGDHGTGLTAGSDLSLTYSYEEGLDPAGIRLRLLVFDDHAPSIADMVSRVSADSIRAHLDSVVGVRHFAAAPQRLEEVSEYISRYMAAHGLSSHHQLFLANNTFFRNMIGRREGLNNQKLCLINAHYDSVDDAPGADDNGSGVAGVLEAVRVLSGYYFENNVQFTTFNLEELGLIGSYNYVNSGIVPGEEIVGLINFEMIGYYSDQPNSQTVPPGFELLFPAQVTQIIGNQSRGDFIINCGNTASNALYTAFNQAAARYVPDLKVIGLPVPGNGQIAPDLRRSDHAPFWDKGYPAIMITDGAETRNHNYHSPNDDVSTIDYDFLTRVASAGIATLADIARPLNATATDIDLSVIAATGSARDGKNSLLIRPNPAKDFLSFTYRSDNATGPLLVTVIAEDGSTVGREAIARNAGHEYGIRVKGLAPGPYILRISDGTSQTTGRFVLVQ